MSFIHSSFVLSLPPLTHARILLAIRYALCLTLLDILPFFGRLGVALDKVNAPSLSSVFSFPVYPVAPPRTKDKSTRSSCNVIHSRLHNVKKMNVFSLPQANCGHPDPQYIHNVPCSFPSLSPEKIDSHPTLVCASTFELKKDDLISSQPARNQEQTKVKENK